MALVHAAFIVVAFALIPAGLGALLVVVVAVVDAFVNFLLPSVLTGAWRRVWSRAPVNVAWVKITGATLLALQETWALVDTLDVFNTASILAVSVSIADSEAVVKLCCAVDAAVFDFILPQFGAPLELRELGFTTAINA